MQTASAMWRLQLALQIYTSNPHVSPRSSSKIQSIAYSDSILLYSEEAGTDGLLDLIIQTGKVTATGMGMGIPLRGAVTRGDLCVSENRQIFAGPGLIRAYDLEQRQEWAGVILDPLLMETAEDRQAIDVALATHLLRPYNVPSKGEGHSEHSEFHLTIDWTKSLHGADAMLLQRGFEAALGKPDLRAQSKQEATLRFWGAPPNPPQTQVLREEARKRAVEWYRSQGSWETISKERKASLSGPPGQS